jgi:NTE family protein
MSSSAADTITSGRTGTRPKRGRRSNGRSPQPLIGVVTAGAGARGAYEAGVLSVLVPALHDAGMPPRVFVGTSAGAINAALFAATAHLDPRDAAEQVLAVWRGVDRSVVFRSVFRSAPMTLARFLGQFASLPGTHVYSLLDTRPLRRTAEREIDWEQLHKNVQSGAIQALAIAATAAVGRTKVFVDRADGVPLPPTDDARALDYLDTTIEPDHVLASSAIPVAFPPVRVTKPQSADGWYTDGGVRLNAPLKPALALGVDRVAVVATHPAVYPPSPSRASALGEYKPDLDEGAVQVVDAALADRMVEDLLTLGKINELIDESNETGKSGYRVVPYMFVGPKTRPQLGEIAEQAYRERYGGLKWIRSLDFSLIHRLIGPRELSNGDLLSYLFFDKEFINEAIKLGQRHARNLLKGGRDPWSTGRPR